MRKYCIRRRADFHGRDRDPAPCLGAPARDDPACRPVQLPVARGQAMGEVVPPVDSSHGVHGKIHNFTTTQLFTLPNTKSAKAHNLPFYSLPVCTHLWPRGCFSSQPTIPLKQHYGVNTTAPSVHLPAPSRRMIGVFRSIETWRFHFEFKFEFQIRTPIHLWLGTTTIAPRHQQTHPRVFTL